MKNYEKYAKKIREYKGSDFCEDIVKPYILKSDSCSDLGCDVCHMRKMLWLLEDYEEPKELAVDWSKVKVDTPILVREFVNGEWEKRYFAKFENKTVFAWAGGRTSWNETTMYPWKYAKLADSEEGGAE